MDENTNTNINANQTGQSSQASNTQSQDDQAALETKKNKPVNTLFDPSTDNQEITEDVQTMLNKPQAGGEIVESDRTFLDQIMKLVDDGTINLYQPSTLLNAAVYDSLEQRLKAKADQNAVVILTKIREIVDLERAPMDTNYQENNLISALRMSKERTEKEAGDVFII